MWSKSADLDLDGTRFLKWLKDSRGPWKLFNTITGANCGIGRALVNEALRKENESQEQEFRFRSSKWSLES